MQADMDMCPYVPGGSAAHSSAKCSVRQQCKQQQHQPHWCCSWHYPGACCSLNKHSVQAKWYFPVLSVSDVWLYSLTMVYSACDEFGMSMSPYVCTVGMYRQDPKRVHASSAPQSVCKRSL